MAKKTKYPKCPVCLKTTYVIRFGKRNNKIRFTCKACNKFFFVNFSHDKLIPSSLLADHLDGHSFRKISNNVSLKTIRIFEIISPLTATLPTCIDLTASSCDLSKFSGKLVFDGTYVPVKNYQNKIPLIWAFDYDAHDCPHAILVKSESYHDCRKFFAALKSIGYELIYLVADDNSNIKRAALSVYPNLIFQLRLRHYLENLRKLLKVKSSPTYLHFFYELKAAIYDDYLTYQQLIFELVELNNKHQSDSLKMAILSDIIAKSVGLTNYHKVPNSPRTTNLIEGFNGHLKDRLKSIRGFKSFDSASLWLNAYVLRRRTTKFKACNGKFKHLNGKAPIQATLKENEEIPNLFN